MDAALAEIRFVGELAKIKAEPGDVFVVHVDARLTTQQASALEAHVRARVPGFPVLVLDNCSRLVVASSPVAVERGAA